MHLMHSHCFVPEQFAVCWRMLHPWCVFSIIATFFFLAKLKKWLLEEKEESLNLLRSKLEEKYSDSMRAAKQQWLKEKGEQVEKEVALAKVHWEKEEKKVWSFYLGISNEPSEATSLFSEGGLVCMYTRLTHCASAI